MGYNKRFVVAKTKDACPPHPRANILKTSFGVLFCQKCERDVKTGEEIKENEKV